MIDFEPNCLADEDKWTLPMVAAWILTRDMQMVWQFSPENPAVDNAQRALSRLDIVVTVFEFERGNTTDKGASFALQELMRALKKNRLNVSGISEATSEFVHIPNDRIQAYKFSWYREPSEPAGCLKYVSGQYARQIAYRMLEFSRPEILSIWPETGATADEASPAVAAPNWRPAPAAWYEELIRLALDLFEKKSHPPLTKRELEPIVLGEIARRSRNSSREILRRAFKQERLQAYFPNKRGPRGPRDPSREIALEELRGFLQSAQLRN